jgi:hypothetical protein
VRARRVTRVTAILLVVCAAAARADEAGDGFHTEPSVFWQSGDNRFDLNVAVRSRFETWDAFAMDSDSFVGTRTRLKATYTWKNQLVLVGEVQDVRVASLDPDGTGGLANYRIAADGDWNAHGTDVHLLWAEFRATPQFSFRVGRQDLKVGPEVTYPEAEWRYLKTQRLGERLVGSVGFSHEERAADGLTISWDLGGHQLLAFAAQPTSGVFEVDNAYRSLHDVTYEGAEWTVKRGTWLPNTELTGFAIAYQDTRPPVDGGLLHGLSLATFGGSALGVYSAGPGLVDLLLWGAGQLGSYNTLDHAAWAVFLEAGYQLPDVFAKPWLRAGINVGSGDHNPNDGDHQTFFNVLPTNHAYYGFIDQVELPNLVDPFVQLRLTPHEKVALNLFAHWFRLTNSSDTRYAGSGVFNLDTFGFSAAPSRGFTHVGREYDVVATFTPHRALTIEAAWSWFDGGAMFGLNRSRNAHYGYISAELKY